MPGSRRRRHFVLTRLLPALFGLVLIASSLRAEPWPMWRGPRLDGVSAERGPFPSKWSARENIVWKCAIPGTGHSSPVLWGDRIYLTSCVETTGERLLLCIDRKGGKIAWQKAVLKSPLEKKHDLNSYASSTPTTDGKHIWVTFL